jgi:hypothetical protein
MPVFKGFIKDVKYNAHLTPLLELYGFEQFDINETKSVGLVQTSRGTLAFSKWVSPKPTRSYPFERIYNSYNNQKIITIIPIIKDEGIDGDSDFISYKTFSWMSLLNVYVILAYYSSASKRPGLKQKITNQKFDVDFIREQIDAVTQYKQSALHWNRTLLKDQFTNILKRAIHSYQAISVKTGVGVHDYSKRLSDYLKDLETYQKTLWMPQEVPHTAKPALIMRSSWWMPVKNMCSRLKITSAVSILYHQMPLCSRLGFGLSSSQKTPAKGNCLSFRTSKMVCSN